MMTYESFSEFVENVLGFRVEFKKYQVEPAPIYGTLYVYSSREHEAMDPEHFKFCASMEVKTQAEMFYDLALLVRDLIDNFTADAYTLQTARREGRFTESPADPDAPDSV